MIGSCEACSKIYNSHDEYYKEHPNEDVNAFIKNENGIVEFFVPCEEWYYSASYEYNYCPYCGRLINENHVVYR